MAAEKPDIQAIFNEATSRDSDEERAAYLDEVCGDNLQVRKRVEALLLAHSDAGGFFGGQATEIRPIGEKPGTQIGPYKLLQEIGEGGMGVVFMAEQTEPVKRRVALKIIKPGMDTRQVIARFEAERQALAMMDHPNIAKVLDAGTTDSGRPYFVMELVKGMPITQYCDEKHLTPRERLELFVPLCHAVQHAHQKGIIHRDIKPSNVMVALYDDRPVPKVIDFGVAKATSQRLTEKTMFTEYGQVVGTMEYMSPEQANLNQLDVDTRSDIYSLGVLLYELLVGETPFDRQRLRTAAFDELLRIIREEEPPRPSIRLSTSSTLPSIAANRHTEPKKLGTLVRGELDWIVMKALEKDRTRRYETANAFADDIKHYINDDAVVACPPSAAYQFRKFARRNKVALATGAMMAATLIVGITLTGWQAYRATHEASRANRAEELAQQRYEQETQSRREADQSREEERRQREVAELLRQRAASNLNLALLALDDIYLKAIGEERLLAGLFVNKETPQHLAEVDSSFSTEERELLKRGLEFYQQFARDNQQSGAAAVHAAQANYRVAVLHAGLGELDQARLAFEAAISGFQAVVDSGGADAVVWSELAKSQSGIAATLNAQQGKKNLEAAEAACSEAIRLSPEDASLYAQRGDVRCWLVRDETIEDFERAAELEPDNAERHLACAAFYSRGPVSRLRNYEKAIQHAERAIELAPNDAEAWQQMGSVLLIAERKSGLEKTLHYLDRALEIDSNCVWALLNRAQALSELDDRYEKALIDVNRAAELRPHDYRPYFGRARIYARLGEFEKAFEDAERANQLAPSSTQPMRTRAFILCEQGNYAESIAEYSRAIEQSPEWSALYNERAHVYRLAGDLPAAITDMISAISLAPNASPLATAELYVQRGNGYRDLGKIEDAIHDYEKAIELGSTSIWLYNNLARCYRELGDADKVIATLDQLVKQNPDNADSWHKRAEQLLQRGRYDDAVADYTKALELDPDHAWARLNRGFCRTRLGQRELAMEDYQATNGALSDDHNFLFTRGERLLEHQRFEEALRDLERAIEITPGKTHYRKRAALAHFRLGQFEDALADLQIRVEACPEDTNTIVYIGPSDVVACPNVEFQNGLRRLADRMVELVPDNADALVKRGIVSVAFGDLVPAMEDFTQALHLSPNHPSARRCRAEASLKAHLFDQARSDYAMLLTPENKYYYDHYTLAMLCLALKDEAGYRASCQTMLERLSDTDDHEAANFAAWTCSLIPRALDDYTPAIALATKATEARPDNNQFLNSLGAVLYRAGRQQEALERLTSLAHRLEEPGVAASNSSAYTWYFLALAHGTAGHEEQASEYLKKANASADALLSDEANPPVWNRRLTLELLRKEAETAIESAEEKLPETNLKPEQDTNELTQAAQEQG